MERPRTSRDLLSVNGVNAQGSRPGTQQQSQPRTPQVHTPLGSAPGSRNGPPPSGGSRHPSRTGRTSASIADTGMSLLQGKLIQKFRMAFGEAAADLQGQEIITQEVLNGMKKGQSVREEDIQLMQNRIRARLVGGTPVKNTLADNKRAVHAGDEWANIYQFNIAEGKELDRALAMEEKERQRRVKETLDAQKRELAERKAAELREEQQYASKEKAELAAWKKQEEERQRLEHDIAQKLKQERVEQLQDKNSRRQRALAAIRADEDDMAARLAYETKNELDKEEATRQTNKIALRNFLLQNEANKALKEKDKHARWEEDAYYKKAWEEVLDKQEKERIDRLNRTLAKQTKSTEHAEKLPEYKRWIDPAIIERHWREREEALDKDEAARKTKLVQARKDMQKRLEDQIQEREAAKVVERRREEELGRQVLAKARAEEEREQAKKAAREAAKLGLNADIKNQMKDNVAIKRYQPITAVERSLNRDLLDRVHDWKLTGSVDCSNSLKVPRHLRTTVKI